MNHLVPISQNNNDLILIEKMILQKARHAGDLRSEDEILQLFRSEKKGPNALQIILECIHEIAITRKV